MQALQTDVAVMFFCGLSQLEVVSLDPSTMTKFRHHVDRETLARLEEASLQTFLRKAPQRRRHQTIADSTCVEANITFPTDTKLLATVITALTRMVERGRAFVKTTGTLMQNSGSRGKALINTLVIRGKRSVKRMIKGFNLKRRKTKAEVATMRKRLVSEARTVLQMSTTVATALSATLKNESNQVLNHTWNRLIARSAMIINQQQALITGALKSSRDRIVSLHESAIRPIYRGKEHKPTEFGQKLGVSVVGGGLLMTTALRHDNFSDTELVNATIKKHEETFHRKPQELGGDRGLHAPENHRILRTQSIIDGIQYRGVAPKRDRDKLPSQRTGRRMYGQRSVVEAKIGLAKRKDGLHRNISKDENCGVLVTFGFLAMNATWAAGRG